MTAPRLGRGSVLFAFAFAIVIAAPLLAQTTDIPNIAMPSVAAPRPSLPAGAGSHLYLKERWNSLSPERRAQIWAIFKEQVGAVVAEESAAHMDPPGFQRIAAPAGDQYGALQITASASVVTGRAPLTVSFSADVINTTGTDPSYQWSFGDHATTTADTGLGSGAAPVHTFEQPGTYVVSVLATNQAGISDVKHIVIRATNAKGQAPTTSGTPIGGTRPRPNPPLVTRGGTPDADGDGLPDAFERQLADSFTPAYALSFFELPNVGMSTYADRPNELTVTATYPTYFFEGTTAVSYFRVTPLAVQSGLSYLRIDYLEEWNEDTGLALNDACGSDIDIFDFLGLFSPSLLTGLFGHRPDTERAAFRAVAPAAGPNGDQVNLDPSAYIVDAVFTAAHEGSLFDHSMLFPALINPGGHLPLYLSLSKHATYVFWPQGFPLMPSWMIDSIYFGVFIACQFVDYNTCDLLYFIADELVFDCITEKHVFQGFVLAPPELRINVGEPGHALPGNSWIEVPKIRGQLLMPLF